MEFITHITVAEDNQNSKSMTIREACRAVIFDENNMMPLLFVVKGNYHKLPG